MFAADDIKSRARQQPFRPFRIVTSSGEDYDVTHPDLVWVGTRELMVGSGSKKDPSLYDAVSRIALMHVTALEDLAAQASKKKGSKGNGQG